MRAGSTDAAPLIVAVDYLGIDALPGVTLLKADFLEPDVPAQIKAALGGHFADLVLSDMAAPTTGHKSTDHLRIVALCEAAADFAREVLKPGGAFLAKVFRGGTENALLADLKRDFAKVQHVKPPAAAPTAPSSICSPPAFTAGTPRPWACRRERPREQRMPVSPPACLEPIGAAYRSVSTSNVQSSRWKSVLEVATRPCAATVSVPGPRHAIHS